MSPLEQAIAMLNNMTGGCMKFHSYIMLETVKIAVDYGSGIETITTLTPEQAKAITFDEARELIEGHAWRKAFGSSFKHRN